MKHLRLPIILTLYVVLSAPPNLVAQNKNEKQLPADCDWYFTGRVYKTGPTGFGQIAYSKKNPGIGFINEAGKPAGDVPVDGYILSLGIASEGIIVFYTKDYNFNRDMAEKIGEVHALLIDPKEKKIVADKLIYRQHPARYLDARAVNDVNGNFDFLSIAVLSNSYSEACEGANCIYLAKDLSPTVKPLHSVCVGGNFMEITTDGRGSFYLASNTADQINLEKFNDEGTLLGKLSTPADFRKDYNVHSLMRTDTGTGRTVYLSVVHTSKATKNFAKYFYGFDFSANRVLAAANVEMDKAYKKQLLQGHSDLTSSMIENTDWLQPLDIIVRGDKIITIGEIQFPYFVGGNANFAGYPRFSSEAAFVCVYDKDLKLQKEYVLNKYMEGEKTLMGLSTHFKDDKLYIISFELPAIETYALYCYTIDFTKGTVDKKKLANGASGTTIPPTTVLWVGDNCLMSHLLDGVKLLVPGKKRTTFIWTKYEEYK